MIVLSKSSRWIISRTVPLPRLSCRRGSHECCLHFGASDLEVARYLKQLHILHWHTKVFIAVSFCICVGVCVCAPHPAEARVSLVFDIRWRRRPCCPRSWVQKAKSKIRGLHSILTSLPNFSNIRVICLRVLCSLNVTLPGRRHCCQSFRDVALQTHLQTLSCPGTGAGKLTPLALKPKQLKFQIHLTHWVSCHHREWVWARWWDPYLFSVC